MSYDKSFDEYSFEKNLLNITSFSSKKELLDSGEVIYKLIYELPDEFVVQDNPIVNTNSTNIATGIIFTMSGYPINSANVSLLINKVAIDATTNKTIPNAVFIT